ncbi:hypothetical protein BD410DRAFT_809586 [Rickenella mellea]|uniref:Uncharacterized protein n=1 Tax=Rickenella mellea TaxID=50990 RepID=A0A4Y7PHX8_9AGAM|nr:hypothetical protein BD410DRAFT_809586 [Rickenella mellea]
MTAVVEAIPTLLHVSLFLFIVGLVIFLFPISRHVALTLLIVLTAVVILYVTKKEQLRGSMADGRELLAIASSYKRLALEWTLESATTHSEIKQFFDAVHSFYRPSARGTYDVLWRLGLMVFDRSVPILRDLTGGLAEVATTGNSIEGGNPLDSLQTDSDATIATQAVCTTAFLASCLLFYVAADWTPSKLFICDQEIADEQLLMDVSDKLPVNELATSMEVQDYPNNPTPIAVASTLLQRLKGYTNFLNRFPDTLLQKLDFACSTYKIQTNSQTAGQRIVQYGDTLEHSDFIAQTLRHIYYADLSPSMPWLPFSINDMDQETLTKFIHIIKTAVSDVHGTPPFTFHILKPFIDLLSELEHPRSVALALNAIEGSQWLLDNNFPWEETVQRLKAKLPPEVETIPRMQTTSEPSQDPPGSPHVDPLTIGQKLSFASPVVLYMLYAMRAVNFRSAKVNARMGNGRVKNDIIAHTNACQPFNLYNTSRSGARLWASIWYYIEKVVSLGFLKRNIMPLRVDSVINDQQYVGRAQEWFDESWVHLGAEVAGVMPFLRSYKATELLSTLASDC